MALISGTKLGPYEIQSLLGSGGMGEVYRARDTRLGRDVAIKVLPAHLSSDPDLKLRMEREAKAISSLNHPHICTLHDIGSQDGVNFLVMEHLEGETLADRLQKGAIPLDEALKIAIEIAGALDKAHARGIVHRDLKPANIMLTKNGPKLMDFGLAKPSAGFGAASGENPLTPSTPTMTVAALAGSSSPLTQKGMVVGTFQYMAPEVLQGAEADVRADIFSFGCVLYEMVTRRRAFEGKSQFSVLGAILDKDPERVSTLRPSSPARLDETVGRCLAKNPENRYGCMHDVRIQLEAIAAGGAETAAVGTETLRTDGKSSWLPWLIAAVAASIAIGAGVGYLLERHEPAMVVRSSIVPPAGTSFMTMLPAAGPPVLSPDGTRLAFTARDEKSKVMLYVRSLAALEAQALPGTDDATYPFWSPDGREIGFFAAGKLRKISASGGPPQDICESIGGRGGAWSKDGVIVFTPSSNQALLRVPAAGGTPEPASKLDTAQGENSHRWPYFLPDSKHFLFWSRTSRVGQSSVLYIGELGTLQPKLLMKSETMGTYASGRLLFLRGQTLMAQPFDASRMELSGEPQPLAERIAINGASVRAMFSTSNTGTLIYQTGEASTGWNLVWRGRDGKQTDGITKTERYLSPQLSPDGARVAVTIFAGGQGVSDIWIFDLARQTSTRFTFGPASQTWPVWSADGKTIFYGSNLKGPNQIYAKVADGSGAERAVLETAEVVVSPRAVTPDGRYLIYARRAKGEAGYHIWGLPLFGDGKPFAIVQDAFDEDYPTLSADGKWMAYQSNESGRKEVYITAFPGGGAKWQVSSNGGSSPKWRKDGKELFFLDLADTFNSVDVNAAGGAPRLSAPHVLFQAVGIQRDFGPYDVTPDGKKFLVNSGNLNEGADPFTLVLNWPAELKK
jgi:Tol biopolymer transport system component